jgi:hypothetical protein
MSAMGCDLNQSTQHWHPTVLWGFQTSGTGGTTRLETHCLNQAARLNFLINRGY